MGVVAVGEGADEVVRLREAAGLLKLRVRGVLIAPAEIFFDAAGKQLVLLQHHAHGAAQRVEVVLAHVHAADLHAALRHVVETGNELHEGRFARAGAAEDADGLARGNVEVDVPQRVFLRAGGILEAHAVKVHGAVRDGHDRRGGIGERGLLAQDLADTLDGFGGHGEHHIDHGDHHQRHEHLNAVGEHGGKLADVDGRAAVRDDELRADEEHEHHIEVHAQLHERGVERDHALGVREVAADVVARGGELLRLVALTREALHHAHRAHVFLHGFVELIVLAEHRAERGHGLARDEEQPDDQHRHDDHKGQREPSAHNERHDDGEDHHQRGADRDADAHHVRHLHILNVGGHARDERGGRELVNVLERKALYLGEEVMAHVFGKAGRRLGAGKARRTAAHERDHRQQHEHKTHAHDAAELRARLDLIDEVCRFKGNNDVDGDLG